MRQYTYYELAKRIRATRVDFERTWVVYMPRSLRVRRVARKDPPKLLGNGGFLLARVVVPHSGIVRECRY